MKKGKKRLYVYKKEHPVLQVQMTRNYEFNRVFPARSLSNDRSFLKRFRIVSKYTN